MSPCFQACEECNDEDDQNVRLCAIRDRDTAFTQRLNLCRFCFDEIAGTAKIDERDWYKIGAPEAEWDEIAA